MNSSASRRITLFDFDGGVFAHYWDHLSARHSHDKALKCFRAYVCDFTFPIIARFGRGFAIDEARILLPAYDSHIVQNEAFVDPEHVDLRLQPLSPLRRIPCPAARCGPSSSGERAPRHLWQSRYQPAGFLKLVPGMGFGSCDCRNAFGLVRREKSACAMS